MAEVERTRAQGIHGVSFAFPQQFGYPHISDPHWDPLWRVCQETGLSVNLHIGSGGSMGMGASNDFAGHSEMRWLAEASTRAISANTQVMSTILFSGILSVFRAQDRRRRAGWAGSRTCSRPPITSGSGRSSGARA